MRIGAGYTRCACALQKCNAKLNAIAGTSAFRAQAGSLFQPGIKLRMFGPVRKIAGRGTKVQERYLFLVRSAFGPSASISLFSLLCNRVHTQTEYRTVPEY